MPFATLKNVRIAFTQSLVEPKDYDDNGVFRRSATFLVEPGSENDKAIRAAINAAATATWLAKAEKTLKAFEGNSNKIAYLDGDDKADKYEGFEGMWTLAGHRKVAEGAPLLLDNVADPETGKPARLLTSQNQWKPGKEGRIYAGCFVNAKVEIYAQAGKFPGVRCTLGTIQFWKDGDSFSGAAKTSDDGFDVAAPVDMADDLSADDADDMS